MFGLRAISFLLALVLLTTAARHSAFSEEAQARKDWEKRWVYVPSNLYVNENLPKIESILKRAKAAGYNGVLFADYKTFTWWKLDGADRWKANAEKLRAMTKDMGMELTVAVFPFGYAGALLFHDPNLASGMPVKDAPLEAKDGTLVPVQTTVLKNGSFEEYTDNAVARMGFQDDPGKSSFIDTEVVKEGKVSLRFEDVGKVNPHGHGRVSQQITVQPWQQYRMRVWMKADKLTADEVKLLVIGGDRTLQWQYPVAPQGKSMDFISRAQNLTTDWVEESVSFNSLDNTKVQVYIGIWGGKTGKIWWDDWRIDSTPTLNLLRRDTLPLIITGADGTVYEEGKDFEKVVDKEMGTKPWAGCFDTRHEPPVIKLTADSRIKNGDKVKLSCWHTEIVLAGQMNCSMSNPKVFDLCRQEMEKTKGSLAPDGYFMSHDEIRCGGWEPEETDRFKTSGELFAFNIKECAKIAFGVGENKPVYVWSDMFDPNHNAHANFYLTNNTIEGSWEGLDKNVIIMKWGGGKLAKPGLEFFSKRGHRQMIAAYYDGDVAADYKMWTDAAKDISNIIGVMYTTWENNYSNMEKFAETWWGGAVKQP